MKEAFSEVVNYQADVIKALGHPLRIQLVDFLHGKEQSVTEITRHFGTNASSISRQLAILKRAGILASRKSGLNVYYHVAMTQVPDVLRYLARSIRKRFA